MKIQQIIIACVMAALLSALAGCSRGSNGVKDGGLYYFKNPNGSYSVLKILKSEGGGVHVRVYSNQFDSPPTKVDESTLFMAGLNHKENETLGIADVPLKWRAFENYKATLFQQSTVSPQELEGYNTWKKAGGDYF
jgi:hypothetical protein